MIKSPSLQALVKSELLKLPCHNGGTSTSSVLPHPVIIAKQEKKNAVLTDGQASLTGLHRRSQAIRTSNVWNIIAGRYEIFVGLGSE